MSDPEEEFNVGDLVCMVPPAEPFQGRVLRTTVGANKTYQVSFDLTLGPDKVVWMKREQIKRVEKACCEACENPATVWLAEKGTPIRCLCEPCANKEDQWRPCETGKRALMLEACSNQAVAIIREPGKPERFLCKDCCSAGTMSGEILAPTITIIEEFDEYQVRRSPMYLAGRILDLNDTPGSQAKFNELAVELAKSIARFPSRAARDLFIQGRQNKDV